MKALFDDIIKAKDDEIAKLKAEKTRAVEAAEEMSQIIHSLEERGIELNQKEDRQWERATAKLSKGDK